MLTVETQNQMFAEQMARTFARSPIPFEPVKSKRIELEMARQIKKYMFTIPIVHIKKEMYLIGTNWCKCELRGGEVVVIYKG